VGESAHLGFDAVVQSGGFEAFEQFVGAGHVHAVSPAYGNVSERGREVCLSHPDREVDRLQHLRAVLPCEVRVTGEAHPLFGRLVKAASFKRWNGVLHLVIELPDGSPGTIRADVTDVLGSVAADGPAVVVDAEGLRRLRSLVTVLGSGTGRDGAGR
jgi:hypothetical protein